MTFDLLFKVIGHRKWVKQVFRKRDGRFGRTVRQKTWFRIKTNPFWVRNTWGTNIGVFYPQNPPKLPPKSGFSMLNSNAAANLGAKYVKMRGLAQPVNTFVARNTCETNLGYFAPKPQNCPPKLGFSMLNSKSITREWLEIGR